MTRSHFFLIVVAMLFSVNSSRSQDYVLLGWNDLGMHCSNKDFSKIAVLPPYNNITAQLIKKAPGQPPELVTTGFSVEYSIPNNTYSVGKTNFWTYAQTLFGLSSPLPDNIGLTGKGLTGVLDATGNSFQAHGIPITPFPDSNLVTESPYQLIHLVAKRTSTQEVVATTDVVIPVSNEVGCVQSGCHSSEQAILNRHEDVTGFNRNGPVLCAKCHASNALGTTGTAEAKSFSYRIHSQHREISPTNSINTCYKCHPGPNTQCLRDVMRVGVANPMTCQNCHGTMDTLAVTINRGRRPWLDEPRCGNTACHGSNYAEESGKLFRESKGHGALYCSACHGSPHAIVPTREANDNLQNTRLQGYAGALQSCSVCHTTAVATGGPHGITALPVQLVSFSAHVAGGRNVELRWRTLSEVNNYGFEVQRMLDNQTYITLQSSFTAGHGTTNEPHDYMFVDANVSQGSWHYRLMQLDTDGSIHFSDPVEVSILTDMNSSANLLHFALEQNYPNPFNPQTGIRFSIPAAAHVTLTVFDALGEEVARLIDQDLQPGSHSTTWSGAGAPSGVYFYRLNAGKSSETKKLLLVR